MSVEIDYSEDDFSRYYQNTVILHDNMPFFARRMGGGLVEGILYNDDGKEQALTLPLSKLMCWESLRQAPLGWSSYGPRPAYLQRTPQRNITKGHCSNNVMFFVPPWWSRMLAGIGFSAEETSLAYNHEFAGLLDREEYWRASISNIVSCIREHRTKKETDIASEVAAIVGGDKLYSVLSKKAMICINPFSNEHPVVGFCGELVVARYTATGQCLSDNLDLWQESITCE